MKSNDYGVGIIGTGKYIPKKIISNKQIEEWAGIPAKTIIEKTGVENRYIIEEGETASGISTISAQKALEMASIKSEQLDLILGCTFSGDYVYPAMACKIQEQLEAWNAGAFDIMANCTGFQVGLGVASDRMYCDPNIKFSLVVGTAVQSKYIKWNDPNTAMYFGDGSGAAILGQVPAGYGILANEIMSNGRVYEAVRLRGGGSSYPIRENNVSDGLQYYEMNGMEVWKQVIQYQPIVIKKVLEKINKKIEDVDFFIFHQANLRLIEYLMARMKQPMSKTYTNIADIGNTADASLAIALCEAVEKGLIKRGDLVVITGVGAGFTFGATAMRWY
ncbi:3-oxoacyl-[acyl-carrier-protein] synthase-3 [Anaerosolibacter carboniphilus]|uniref:3-oxoacyl-[acyl-carrier-protein] synthase-3 n=1 Tax=Anaerosolibacter carboniphilus TaxID=1417629 RepID=A0A841KSN1_9FIRM|nr:3-oxoacyl-[acyl-carrier-protein] synthase-3 [Anaerosolibacter carboniphilus]